VDIDDGHSTQEKDELFESNVASSHRVSSYSKKPDNDQIIEQENEMEKQSKLPTSSKANLFESIFDKDEDDFDDLFKNRGSNRN